jgi:hypothetical protein
LIRYVDGSRSIREITELATGQDGVAGIGSAEKEDYARRFFEALWRLDFLAATFGKSRHGEVG